MQAAKQMNKKKEGTYIRCRDRINRKVMSDWALAFFGHDLTIRMLYTFEYAVVVYVCNLFYRPFPAPATATIPFSAHDWCVR